MKIITSSSLPSALLCMRKAAAGSFGARGKMDSEFRDAIESILPPMDRRQGVFAVVGTAAHKGAEIALTPRLSDGEANVSECLDAAMESLHQAEDVEYENEITNAKNAEKVVRKLVRFYAGEVAPNISPILIEERLKAGIGGSWVLSGQIDVIDDQKNAGDHKFGNANGYMAQIGSGIILANANQIESTGGWIDSIKRPRGNADPQYNREQIDGKNAKKLAVQVINEMKDSADKFLQDGNLDHFRANPGNMLCSDKYCRAYGTIFCEFTRKS